MKVALGEDVTQQQPVFEHGDQAVGLFPAAVILEAEYIDVALRVGPAEHPGKQRPARRIAETGGEGRGLKRGRSPRRVIGQARNGSRAQGGGNKRQRKYNRPIKHCKKGASLHFPEQR